MDRGDGKRSSSVQSGGVWSRVYFYLRAGLEKETSLHSIGIMFGLVPVEVTPLVSMRHVCCHLCGI